MNFSTQCSINGRIICMEYQHHIVMIANHNLNIMMTTIGKDTTGILGLKSLVELTTLCIYQYLTIIDSQKQIKSSEICNVMTL